MRGWLIGVLLVTGCKQIFGLEEPSTGAGTVDDAQPLDPDARPDATPACSNGEQDNLESDIDCGPGCAPCGNGKRCTLGSDCMADSCIDNVCRLPYSCNELHQLQPTLGDGAYAIDVGGTTGAVTTFCDMTIDGGGWTLVGKVDGRHDMANVWLISSQNLGALSNAAIAADTYACVDAVPLAVGRATQVRITNSNRDRWIRWSLPAGRAMATFWRHSTGQNTIEAAPTSGVTVQRSGGQTNACQQNNYGINPYPTHGGGYPYSSVNIVGNTQAGDGCVTVGVTTSSINGFSQNGNGFDAPDDETTWPNNAIDQPVHVAVWLR